MVEGNAHAAGSVRSRRALLASGASAAMLVAMGLLYLLRPDALDPAGAFALSTSGSDHRFVVADGIMR